MWSDALERTAKGLIDTKEAAKNKAYLQALENASRDPDSAGAREKSAKNIKYKYILLVFVVDVLR